MRSFEGRLEYVFFKLKSQVIDNRIPRSDLRFLEFSIGRAARLLSFDYRNRSQTMVRELSTALNTPSPRTDTTYS